MIYIYLECGVFLKKMWMFIFKLNKVEYNIELKYRNICKLGVVMNVNE